MPARRVTKVRTRTGSTVTGLLAALSPDFAGFVEEKLPGLRLPADGVMADRQGFDQCGLVERDIPDRVHPAAIHDDLLAQPGDAFTRR
jgi:hypothetical protein